MTPRPASFARRPLVSEEEEVEEEEKVVGEEVDEEEEAEVEASLACGRADSGWDTLPHVSGETLEGGRNRSLTHLLASFSLATVQTEPGQ